MKHNRNILLAAVTAGSIAAAALAVGAVSLGRQAEAAKARVDRLESRVVDTACGPLEYARAGSGEPVLVIHGMGGGFDVGLGMAQSLLGPARSVIQN